MFSFENLTVYKQSEEVYKKLLVVLDNKKIDRNLRSQLRRALLGIILNIAEGTGKFTNKDKKNFYLISRGSVNECVAVLRILKIEKHITDTFYQEAYNNFTEIGKMLSGLINKRLS